MFLFVILPVVAQSNFVELGQIAMVREHAAWPTPESIVRDLRSSDEDVRLKALALVGVTGPLQRKPIYSKPNAGALVVSNSEVVRPEQIELRYAALGSDETQQAILAVQVGQYGFAAVASPRGNAWERVAAFNCWCKYDMSRFLDEFVSITRAPENNAERFELVIRASGGGSGLYNQDEAHFRFHRGEMKPVLHFIARYVTLHLGIAKPYLEIDRRWFHSGLYGADQSVPGGVLVEGHANLPPKPLSPIEVSA